MIHIPASEAVVIASPTDCHVVHTLAAIENGVHTLCEEPVNHGSLISESSIIHVAQGCWDQKANTLCFQMRRLTEVTERNPKQK